MNERVSFFLKPEACMHAEEIYGEIQAAGFRIERREWYRLTEHELKTLYPDLTPLLQSATKTHLLRVDVALFLISGEDAVNWLLKYAGLNTNPEKCGRHTVRFRYGSKKPVALGKGVLYYWNGIHRPRDRQEAQRDLDLFFGLGD